MDHSHNPDEVKLDQVAEIADAMRRIIVHYGLWLSECVHQFGLDKALEIERPAGDKSFAIQIKRLSEVLGFELKNGLPAALFDLDPEKLAQNFPVEGQDRLLEAVNGEISVNRQEGRLDLQLAPFEQKHE